MATKNTTTVGRLKGTTKRLIRFFLVCVGLVFSGGRKYYAWLAGLIVVILFALYTYIIQYNVGVLITSVRNPLPWGSLPYAQFPFFVGVAGGAIIIEVAAYLYDREDFRELSIYGMALAASASLVAMMAILVMLGRLDRFLYIFPIIGTPRFPESMLPWDAIMLNAEFFLNLIVPGYLVYKMYYGYDVHDHPWWFMALLYTMIPLAIIANVVVAFIMMGAPRPAWQNAILAPRYIASMFAVGSMMLVLGLRVIRTYIAKTYAPAQSECRSECRDRTLVTLGHVALISMLIYLFIFASSFFTAWYNGTASYTVWEYLLFGIEHNGVTYDKLVPVMWGGLLLQVGAIILLMLPGTRRNVNYITLASVMGGLGILFERGLILMISGFMPSPLGEIFEFHITMPGVVVALGLWALFNLVFTVLAKIAIGIEAGPYDAEGKNPRVLGGLIERFE